MRYAKSVTELIGRTPLVRLNSVTDGIGATVLAKLEFLNPGGSVKDRIAVNILDAAEASGELRPGGTIVEPTSGNTGIGLAMAAQLRGYRCIFVCSDKVAPERLAVLRAYGAEVVLTPSSAPAEHPESYMSVARRMSEEIPGAYMPNQFANPHGPRSHYETTGPEVWSDTDGRVTHFVAGAGTGGTVSGAGAYLKEAAAQAGTEVEVVVADPEGSLYATGDHAQHRPYDIEGVGMDFYPETFDRSVVDRYETVPDAEAFALTRRLAREEGLLVGGSSGMAVAAALRVARDLPAEAVVVALLADTGRGYLGKIFDDEWMNARGHGVAPAEDAENAGGDAAHAGSAAASERAAASGSTPAAHGQGAGEQE